MKMIFFRTLSLAAILYSSTIFAQSISYQGFECFNAVNSNDPTPTEKIVESRFEVIEVLDGGMVRLSLSGGLPRFVNNNQNICIDRDTAIGFLGTPEAAGAGGLPVKLENIDATAYFNGRELVIVVNSIFTDLDATRGTFSSFSTSRVQPVSNTLILEYDRQTTSFLLRKLIHNKGFVHTSGSTASFPFIETIVPSFGETGSFELPLILTPPSRIAYRLE
ncbi:MAG: hypothetical protein H6937_01310 [Burkholderiales bacterium]|nr:hypothetical protein [Burkholderiales bacterium]MDR4518220.1 hypothetical protein [Nitrosomonas sp.]